MALLIVFAFAVSIIPMMQTQVKAQTAPSIKTYPEIDAVPDPVGVGQPVLVRFGILQQAGAVEQGWTGITVTVVKPDNTTQTLGPFKTDSTGSSFTQYTPDQVGTYTLTTHFPQQTNPIGFFSYEANVFIPQGAILLASDSAAKTLTVQQEALPDYPGHALPSQYWTRPIDDQLREWYSISGNWVGVPDSNSNYWVSNGLYNDCTRNPTRTLGKPTNNWRISRWLIG